ncbi:hypoxia-inducible factor 1-alpha isoform X2 [Venturia canescens]|uniref:hypoxia-inducible factor 1-alpha isoform X2 n=1 Tax=Venturia canescens TaxID=32260 RepID=UPI001C9CA75E|nr:hypoxia-inducible factor 1-alpha isoform X2 [Venturia canescens]
MVGDSRKSKAKEKRRSNEKRKEKSRDAARSRRSRETDIFTELARALPISPEQPAHLDKASVMRLAIAYLKVRSVIDALEEPVVKCPSLTEMDADFPQALDGFMLVLSSNGDMVYLSDNVSDYLGVTQMEMMGQSVYEYSHPCDHDELRECLSIKPNDVKEKRPCNFFLRLKCTLTSKGRKVNLKSASYKVIHCTGRAMGICEPNFVKTDSEGSTSRDEDSSEYSSKEEEDTEIVRSNGSGCTGASLVIVGSPIPHPSNIEIPLGRQTFLSKHSLNMKFTYADERLAEYLGWASNELLGKSVFEFHHALDNSALDKSFKSLFSKGQCETMAYRFLSKNGGYAWVVTQATLIHCSKQQKPISIVCVNHILSGVECEDEVYSERQLEARKAGVTVNSPAASTIDEYEIEDKFNLQSLPALTIDTPSATDDSFDATNDFVDESDRENQEDKNEAKNATIQNFDREILMKNTKFAIAENSRPLTVTASIFRSQADIASRDSCRNTSASNTTRITKNTDIRRERANWTFQDKPVLEYEGSRNNRPQTVTRNVFVPVGLIQDQELSQQHEQTPACRPQTTTASIFAPRTEDMNKGFLTFSEDQPGLTMLKDEPEDLTHLAPTPGDVCVPLEDTPFLSDMLDEFILGTDNYCPLLNTEDLPTELPNSDLSDSLTKDSNEMCGSLESSLADSDPFIYRDMPSPCSLSPDLLSPSGIGKSPDQNSLGSFRSPKHNDLVDDMMTIRSGTSSTNPITEDEMLMLSINDVIGDEELALRAPYIPMSDQDEALQLLISDDTVMWGPTQPPDKKTKWIQEERKAAPKRYEDSNLARLLKNDTTAVDKFSDHNGGLVNPTQIFSPINEKELSGLGPYFTIGQQMVIDDD